MDSSGCRQYGLIKRQQKSTSKTAAKPCVFGADSDSDSDCTERSGDWYQSAMRAATTGSVQAAQTRQVLRRAAEQDASVFQYDEVYDTLQPRAGDAPAADTGQKRPRYMARLLATAERRKMEHERRVERKVQQEREQEGDEFADKEAFVTEAYKQKLLERQRQDEEERQRRLQEEAYDVTKQSDLSGLYRHLFLKQEKEDKEEANAGLKNGDVSKTRTTVNVKTEKDSSREGSESDDENSDEKNTSSQIKFNKGRKSTTSIRRRRNSSGSSDCENRTRGRAHQTSNSDSHPQRSKDRRHSSPRRHNRGNEASSRQERRSRDRSPRRHSHRPENSAREDGKLRGRSPKRHGHRPENSAREDHGPRDRSRSGGHRHRSDQNREEDRDRRKIDDSAKRKHSPKPSKQNSSATGVLEKSRAISEEERAKRLEKLFTKRTVGDEFEAALARFLARKENGPPLVPVQT